MDIRANLDVHSDIFHLRMTVTGRLLSCRVETLLSENLEYKKKVDVLESSNR